MAKRKIVKRSILGALLGAWWETKKQSAGHQGSVTLTLYDALVLAGLALAWALDKVSDRYTEKNTEKNTEQSGDVQ